MVFLRALTVTRCNGKHNTCHRLLKLVLVFWKFVFVLIAAGDHRVQALQ